jgi:hypothetical protein
VERVVVLVLVVLAVVLPVVLGVVLLVVPAVLAVVLGARALRPTAVASVAVIAVDRTVPTSA